MARTEDKVTIRELDLGWKLQALVVSCPISAVRLTKMRKNQTSVRFENKEASI